MIESKKLLDSLVGETNIKHKTYFTFLYFFNDILEIIANLQFS